MTKRELILASAMLGAVVVATNLWLDLRAERGRGSASNLSLPGSPKVPQRPSAALPEASFSRAPVAPSASETTGLIGDLTPPVPQSRPTSQNPPPNSVPASENAPAPMVQFAQASNILGNDDLNKDGLVTREEARRAGKSLDRMWDRYDENKDGVVEAREIENINKATGETVSTGGVGASMISANDLNGDGVVTRAEATKANKSLGQMWNRFDANRDGVIDANEANRGMGGAAGRPMR